MQCLNTKNKEVAALLAEYTEILGSENAAYYVLSENNGYGLDKAPNGADSKLFADLLSHFNNDTKLAIQAKAKTFTESFKQWFGESKVTDSNSEPLVVYHYSDSLLKEFSIEFDNYFSKQKGGTKKAIFFTENAKPAKNTVLDRDFQYPVYLSASTIIEKSGTKSELTEQGEGFVSTINRASDEADVVLFKGIDDNQELKQNIYVINNPNNVKSIDNQGAFSTLDNNIYAASTGEDIDLPINTTYKTSKDFLSGNDSVLAKQLSATIEKAGLPEIEIEYVNVPLSDLFKIEGVTERTPALYDRNTNKIYVNPNGDFSLYGGLDNVLMHEVVHAITVDALMKDSAKAKELNDIYQQYKKVHIDYASSNVFEFAAEIFSNPRVIDNLDKINSKNQSLLQRLLAFIKSIFVSPTNATDIVIDLVLEYNASRLLEQNDTFESKDYLPTVFPAASEREMLAYNKAKDAFEAIVKTTEQQINSLKYNKINPVFDVKVASTLDKLLLSNDSIKKNLTDDVLENILDYSNGMFEYVDSILGTIDNAYETFNQLSDKIENAILEKDTDTLTVLDGILEEFKQDYIEPHLSNLTTVYNTLTTEHNNNIYATLMGPENFDQLKRIISGLRDELKSEAMIDKDNLGYLVTNLRIRRATSFLRNVGEEANDPRIKESLKNWLLFSGDISFYSEWFGSLSSTTQPILAAARKVIVNVDKKTRRQVYKRFAKFYAVASKVKKSDIKKLFELDENGQKTGFLARDRNYGRWHNKKLKFRQEFLKRNNMTTLDEVQLDPILYKKYKKEYETFKATNVHRKYTPEFYQLYTDLGIDTTKALSDINTDIQNVLQPFLDENKKPRFELMTKDEYDNYNRLLEYKRNLANIYDYETGEIKTGIAADIAKELTALNEKLYGGFVSNVNMSAFTKERLAMANTEGYSPDGSTLYEAWLDRNTKLDYTDEFKKLISENNKKDYGEVYDKLYQARKNLLDLYKTDKGESDYARMPDVVKDKIKGLDELMWRYIANAPKGDTTNVRLFKSELTSEAKKRGGRKALTEDDYFTDEKGHRHVYSYLTKIEAIDKKYMHRVPNKNWYETSAESKFIDNSYDNNITDLEQPRLSIKEYDNRSNFKYIQNNEALYNMYKEILNVMTEANAKLKYANFSNPHKLPQITGGIFDYISNRGFITGVRDYMMDDFAIRPDDEQYGREVETRPNGTEIKLVPTQYVSMLSDPEIGTSDLVKAVTKYYRMACNFENKKAVAPQINRINELIKEQGRIQTKEGAQKSAENSRLSNRLNQLVDITIFGKETIKWTANIGNYTLSLDKLIKNIARWGRDIGLGWNIRSAISGGVSAMSFYASDAANNMMMTKSDFAFGVKQVAREATLFKFASQLGKPQSSNKLFGLLEYNGLTFGENDLSDLEMPRVVRAIKRVASPYALFQMMSFIPNATFTAAVYRNYRLVDMPDGSKRFISRKAFMDIFPGTTLQKTALYDSYTESLWDAYEIKGKSLSIVPKYEQYIDQTLEDTIASSLSYLSSHAEGMSEEVDRGGIYQNAALSTIIMFRGFLPKNIENTLAPIHWNYETKEMAMGTLSALYYTWRLGLGNKFSNTMNKILDPKGNHPDKVKQLQELYPGVNIHDAIERFRKRLKFQIFTWFAWAMVLSSIINHFSDDDDDSYMIAFARLEVLKISTEMGSRYNLSDIFGILNSIAPVTKSLENVWAIMPWTYLNENKYKTIKRGAYKGYEGWQRDLFKVFPITNAYFNIKSPKDKLNTLNNALNNN